MGEAAERGKAGLRLERARPHVALMTLDRPQVMNAIDSALAVAIEAAVRALDADADVRVVVITGAGGRAFCAGADLKEMAADPAASRRTAAGGFAGFVDLPRAKPWIAAVEGAALGRRLRDRARLRPHCRERDGALRPARGQARQPGGRRAACGGCRGRCRAPSPSR